MSLRISWRLLQIESLITRNAAHSVMPLFLLSVGLSQGDLGVKEAICSLVYLIVNLPIGWLADRRSRKASNLIGDVLYGSSLLFLGFSSSFGDALIAGLVMALGSACTEGADQALMVAHCDALEIDYVQAKRRLTIVGSCLALAYSLAGTVLTILYGMKMTILIASIPFFIGAILSCFIKELGTHKEVATQTISVKEKLSAELEGMIDVVKHALLKNKPLSTLLFASSVGAMIGGPVMVFIGPMLLVAGTGESSAGIAYAVIAITNIIGNWLSMRTPLRWPIWASFLAASVASLVIMAVVSLHMTIWAVAIYILIVHTVRGWMIATLVPVFQRAAPEAVRATVGSLRACVSQVLFIVIVLAIGFAGNYGAHWGVATNALLFVPFVVVATVQLARHGPKNIG